MGKFKTLLLAHHVGGNHAIQAIVEQLSANVARRTEGQVTIAAIPNSRLGDLSTLLRTVIESLDLHDIQRYMSIFDYSYTSLVHVINTRALMSLEPGQQEILRDESCRAALLMRQLVRSYEADRLDSFVSGGGRIDRPDPAPFKALIAPVCDAIGHFLGEGIVADCLKVVDRHRVRPQLTDGSSP